MNITRAFQTTGDVLQFVIPVVVGLQDVGPDVLKERYYDAAMKAGKICTLILIQRYGCQLVKWIIQKKRPDGSDLQSFPSGHFMIGTQCLTRTVYRDGLDSKTAQLVFLGTLVLGLGRYLPRKHDVIDLAGGGILGVGLGIAWNKWITLDID